MAPASLEHAQPEFQTAPLGAAFVFMGVFTPKHPDVRDPLGHGERNHERGMVSEVGAVFSQEPGQWILDRHRELGPIFLHENGGAEGFEPLGVIDAPIAALPKILWPMEIKPPVRLAEAIFFDTGMCGNGPGRIKPGRVLLRAGIAHHSQLLGTKKWRAPTGSPPC